MTTRIRFDAPSHHTLDLGENGDPSIINGGQASNVDDETAEQLIDADWLDVTVIPVGAAVWPKSQAKLDELADRLGFSWPETEDGSSLTVKDKVAALEEAGHTPDSVYQPADDQQDASDDGETADAGDEGDTSDTKENEA
jgi:hypothetical protein